MLEMIVILRQVSQLHTTVLLNWREWHKSCACLCVPMGLCFVEPGAMCMFVCVHGPVFCGARCHGPVFCGARYHVHVCVCTWACVLWCQVPSGKLKQELHGHFSLVYDLSWSRKDTHLLSASADGTVRLEVWILLLLLFYLQCCSFIISVCVCVCVWRWGGAVVSGF